MLPEFELGDYKNLQVQVDEIEVGDAQVDKTLEEMRERAATFVPVEGRAAKDGDSVLIKLIGTPLAAANRCRPTICWFRSARKKRLRALPKTCAASTTGETKRFDARYPDDYPDPKLAGKTYDYSVEVQGIKEKKLPELNDEFVKDAAGAENGGIATLEELRKKIRESLDAEKEQREEAQGARKDSGDSS